MIVAGVFFAIVFVWAFFRALINGKNHSSSSIFRFAPSVMTALGLLGTFYGLTESLAGLDTNDIEPFVKSLKPVFSFSILGIGAAIGFMLFNAILMAVNQWIAKTTREENKEDAQSHRNYSKKVNSATLDQLQKSNGHLSVLGGITWWHQQVARTTKRLFKQKLSPQR